MVEGSKLTSRKAASSVLRMVKVKSICNLMLKYMAQSGFFHPGLRHVPLVETDVFNSLAFVLGSRLGLGG